MIAKGLPEDAPRRLRLGTLVVAAVTAIAGCGGAPGLTTVDGQVTIDGEPLENGSIIFEPANGLGPSAGAAIEGGSYTAKMPPGEKKVRISGFEITGQVSAFPGRPDSPMRDVVKGLVPDKYNVNSELTLLVESSETTGDFDLATQ